MTAGRQHEYLVAIRYENTVAIPMLLFLGMAGVWDWMVPVCHQWTQWISIAIGMSILALGTMAGRYISSAYRIPTGIGYVLMLGAIVTVTYAIYTPVAVSALPTLWLPSLVCMAFAGPIRVWMLRVGFGTWLRTAVCVISPALLLGNSIPALMHNSISMLFAGIVVLITLNAGRHVSYSTER